MVQLKGGIIGYLDYMQKNSDSSKWQGECFVFDNRVTVNNKLQSGMYSQCFGCRHPITNEDMQLKSYNFNCVFFLNDFITKVSLVNIVTKISHKKKLTH